MNRLWGRVGVRATSVGLLLAGVAGGVYLGHGKDVQQQAAEAQLVVQSDESEVQLLKARENEHAAARAYRRQAETDAAAKAAAEAKAAASRARALEAELIAKKEAAKKAAEAAAEAKRQSSTSPSSSYSGPIPSSCGDYSGNRKIGCALMLDAGFKIDQFPCLDKLWARESGWNQYASNASTGAYGIPQALPGDKMATVADDWRTNPATQIKWGLGYIDGRYGTPCSAWNHSESTGWY